MTPTAAQITVQPDIDPAAIAGKPRHGLGDPGALQTAIQVIGAFTGTDVEVILRRTDILPLE